MKKKKSYAGMKKYQKGVGAVGNAAANLFGVYAAARGGKRGEKAMKTSEAIRQATAAAEGLTGSKGGAKGMPGGDMKSMLGNMPSGEGGMSESFSTTPDSSSMLDLAGSAEMLARYGLNMKKKKKKKKGK